MPRASTRTTPATKSRPDAQQASVEVIDPGWLLKALAICFVGALVCAYATLCLLFYQGSWQLVLHPKHEVGRTPAAAGIAYSSVRFDASETGQPRLSGWWIPASSGAGALPRFAALTVLYLHDGSGSLSDTVPMLTQLHEAGINVFAFDYRGFGASDSSTHPSASRMMEDSAAALDYLTGTRHISASTIIPYGAGLGASLAVGLAHAHPELPAVILDNPDPNPASTALAERPSRIVPVRLLFGSQFEVAAPLADLATPKLLLAGGPGHPAGHANLPSLQDLFRKAASPKLAVTLPAGAGAEQYQSAISRFLDEYVPGR